MTAYRPLIAAVLFSAALAGAQEVKPRVMVILDTSRSMLEKPDSNATLTQMSEAGGDWNRSTNPLCVNKLCTAKKVVDTVLSQYTADARIGLTTYYQFLLKAYKADTQQTQCIYDVLIRAGELRRFTSLVDLTGSGNTVCAGGANDAACTGPARRVNFPDEGPAGGGGAGLFGTCKSGSGTWTTPTGFVTNGYVRPDFLPNATAPACSGVGCYTLTKTAAVLNSPVTCQLYNDSSTTVPQTYSSSNTNCATNGIYSQISAKTLIRPFSAPIRKFQAPGATSCSGPANIVTLPGGPMLATNYVPTTSLGGAAVPETLMANPSIGTGAGQWNNFAPVSCTSGAPCALYRTSEPQSTNTARAWYGFFDPATSPADIDQALTNPATVPVYPFSARTGGSAYEASISGLTGVRDVNEATSCVPGQPAAVTWTVGSTRRFNSNESLGTTFNIAYPLYYAAYMSWAGSLGSRTDETPTRNSNYWWSGQGWDTTCRAGWPCDVTLVSDVVNPVSWLTGPILYDPAALNPATQRFRSPATSSTPSTTRTYELRINNPAQTSCPAIGTTSSEPVISNPYVSWTATGGVPAGCSSGGPCTFSAPVSGPLVSAPGCLAQSRFNSAALTPNPTLGILAGGVCEWNGETYTSTTYVNDGVLPDGGVTTGNPYRVWRMVLPTDSCGTTFDVTSISAPIGGGGYQAGYISSNVSAGGAPLQATLTYLSESSGPAETSPTAVSRLAVPSGYTGEPTSFVNRGGVTRLPDPGVGAVSQTAAEACGNIATGSVIESANATLGAGRVGSNGTCSLEVLGATQVSSQCGAAEQNLPCRVCRYQPRTFSWQRPSKTCTYSATRTEWRVNGAARTCRYTRPEWQTEVKDTVTHRCTYRVGAARYDFAQPNSTWCEYFAVQTDFLSMRTMYTYEYLTKGNEPIGRARSANTAGNLCTAPWTPGNDFGTACPETRACAGLTSITLAATPLLASSTCRLKVGGSDPTSTDLANRPNAAGNANGRFANFQNINNFFGTGSSGSSPASAVDVSHRSCEAADPPTNADTYKNQNGSPFFGFCSPSGSASITELKLVTDFYAPAPFTDSNGSTISNVNPVNGSGPGSWSALYASVYPPPDWTVTTNNTAFKVQGFSAIIDGGAVIGGGELPARSMFVPIPNDATYNAVAQNAAIQQAMRPCVLPSVNAPGWAFDGGPDGVLKGGACVGDERVREPAPCNPVNSRNCGPGGDITPLYGSLRNTYDYLNERWSTDDNEQQCRAYFMVLATDGIENSPRGYTVAGSSPATSVEGLVATFRNTTYPLTRPDVRTFVIALGTGAASGAELDALNRVANAGGTTQAFGATSLAQLEAALQTVFTNITQGVFSRSRPAIGSDGTRLYTAQFVRGLDAGAGPDQFGLLSAYRVNSSDGTFTLAWEHGGKLNHATHPARSIVVGLRRKIDNVRVAGAFTTANAELVDQLDDNPGFAAAAAAGVTTTNVISFLTNKGEAYTGAVGIRTSRLGPISHSAPIVIGKSPFDPDYGGASALEKAAFGAFKTSADTRPVRVLFEAADGMLHSVIENSPVSTCATAGESDPTCPSGRESWSFIPGSLPLGSNGDFRPLVQSLFKLKQGGWGARYLNNSVSVADVCGNGSNLFADNCVTANWKTVAFVSQREGGRGVAAVDVTTPGVAGWDTGSPNVSGFLWDFADNDLGLTFSAPAAGRVKNFDSKDEFIAIFGGGSDDPGTGTGEGRAVFIVNALNGNLIKRFTKFKRGGGSDIDLGEVIARPATHRRTGANFTYLSSAYVASGPSLYALRFADAAGAPKSNVQNNTSGGGWKPDELFEPRSTRNSQVACGSEPCETLQVRRVFLQTPGNLSTTPPTPPVYALQAASDASCHAAGLCTQPDGRLPLISAPPIYNRPRVASVLVPSGVQSDLLVGTGDARDPNQPELANFRTNYFYAIHDFNDQAGGSKNDGRALWVNQFPEVSANRPEQIVSEPAVITGCVIVATYTVPVSTAGCNRQGDTTLYGFDPLTGNLKDCLVYEGAGNPYAGQRTSVIKMPGVGIPSDLVVINDNVYLSTSGNGLMKAPVRVPPRPGAVRSYRRVK